MPFDIQKFALPLTVAAAFAGLYVWLKPSAIGGTESAGTAGMAVVPSAPAPLAYASPLPQTNATAPYYFSPTRYHPPAPIQHGPPDGLVYPQDLSFSGAGKDCGCCGRGI